MECGIGCVVLNSPGSLPVANRCSRTDIKCQRALFEWNVYIVMTFWYSVVNTVLSFCTDFDIDRFFSRMNCEKLKANN